MKKLTLIKLIVPIQFLLLLSGCSNPISEILPTAQSSSIENSRVIVEYKDTPHLSTTGSSQTNIHVVIGNCDTLNSDPNVKHCEPDLIVSTQTVNNDKLDFLWGFHETDIPAAWQIHSGTNIVIAIIDTGVDINHPSLASSIWVNDDEIPGNGIDDDANGYIDDIHGWDFVNNRAIEPGTTQYDNTGHGTHVAGTIAGHIGVNPHAKIMVLKFMEDNSGYTSDAIRALQYAINNGATLSNHSYGTYDFSQTFRTAINNATQNNHLLIAAAGNDGLDIDQTPFYPAAFNLDNIISVAASNKNNQLAFFSNYGDTSVDILAPGENIYSTLPNNNYRLMSGTSMAAPLVTGILSLGIAASSTTDITQLKESMVANADSNDIINAHLFLSTLKKETSKTAPILSTLTEPLCKPFKFK